METCNNNNQFCFYNVVDWSDTVSTMTEQAKSHFPFEITPVESSRQEELWKDFKGYPNASVLVGPKKYCLPAGYSKIAANIYNLPLRDSDVFVVTFPRSGTTWTQELVWLINNNLDFNTAKTVPLTDRYPFVELNMFINEKLADALKVRATEGAEKADAVKSFMKPQTELLAEMQSRRFVKSHLPLSLLPEKILDTCKVVYVARDPRDVAVSYYHFTKNNESTGYVGEFNDYFKMFMDNTVDWAPFFEHVKEAWAKRHHPNLLFLFYEELSKDLASASRRVADFFGKSYSDEQIAQLCEHLRFDNFRANSAVDLDAMRKVGILAEKTKNYNNFVRKGKAGGWRDTFDAQTAQVAQRWIEDNLRDTDLRFPSHDN